MTRLDIISDPVCPWCYIGKANLEQALGPDGESPFDIHWRPYQLNPDMPPEGMDRKTYLESKFGGPDNAREIYGRIETAAREAGLDVDFARIARSPNTLDAHRLIRWAGVEGAQSAVVDALFQRYFTLGEDISDPKVLRDVAEGAGMDADATARLLATDADRAEVRAEAEEGRAMGVTGVPTFLIGRTYVLTGAQPPDVWSRLIEELRTAAPA